MNFESSDLETCRLLNHRFKTTWSDKTPMKVSLMCVTCSLQLYRNSYVAYGVDTMSRGLWRVRPHDKQEAESVAE